jgi:2-oxoglutarate ferredoxin oxidoreductase subunit alpha
VTTETESLTPEPLAEVVIRFAGDSGDGMQLTGDRFTDVSAAFGNDLATLPNFPAEIRAPAGTIAGVSSFQVQISDHDILTPGDLPTVLVAMNPAALRANINELEPGGTILVNSDSFEQRNLEKAGYQANPLEDGSLSAFRVIQVAMTAMTLESTKELGVKPRDAERSKNFFAPRPHLMAVHSSGRAHAAVDRGSLQEPRARARREPRRVQGRLPLRRDRGAVRAPVLDRARAPRAGHVPQHHGQPRAGVRSRRREPAEQAAGAVRLVPDHTGVRHPPRAVEAQELRRAHAASGDEIAAIGVAIGGAFAGQLGVTGTSGPGVDLKSEAMGLAISLELPLIVVDVQRGGPSTGLPTKTEQADLLLAMYGRHW